MPSLTIEIKKVRGGAVAGATVTIRNNNGEKPEFKQTDPTGKCTFNNLQEGSYSIVAKVPPGLIPPRNGNLPVPPEFKTFRLIDHNKGASRPSGHEPGTTAADVRPTGQTQTSRANAGHNPDRILRKDAGLFRSLHQC